MGYTGDAKREYQKLWMRERRLKALNYLGNSCFNCNATEDLEFDHVDKELKTHNISNLLSRKWEVLANELDKCQLLCYSCHLEKSIDESTLPFEHGNRKRGYYRGCRCELCTEANTNYIQKWRSEKNLRGLTTE